MRRILIGAMLMLAGLAAGYGYSASSRERNYRQLIARGEAALTADDTFAAAEAFTSAIAYKDDSMLGYLKRGETYRRRSQLRSAADEKGRTQDLEAAMRDLRRAFELDSLAPGTLELLGDVSYALARFDRAAERYQACLELDDRSPRVMYKLALAHYTGGRFNPALAALRKAIAIDEGFAEAYYLLGLTFRDLQKPRESLRALETAVRLAPAMLQAREELGDLYGRLGRSDDRIAQLEALLALDPDAGPSRQVAVGLAYAQAGRVERAVTTLGQAAERYPDHSYTYVALGRVWLEKTKPRPDRADLSKALGALQGIVGTDATSEALMLFGRALLLTDDDESAERVLKQATEKLPVDPLAFYYLADAAERRGNPDVARRALLDYRALEGEHPDDSRRAALAVRVADLSMALDDGATAAAWYQRAVDATAPDAPLLVRLAEAQVKSGAFDAARATVVKALDKDPANGAARILQRRIR